MNYNEFKVKFQDLPFILSSDVLRSEKKRQNILNQLNRWQKNGLIIRLRKGMYVLNKTDRRCAANECIIANNLYTPSYLSLEYALNFYGLIPEKVFDLTSVTTRKTMRFKSEFGTFTYQHVSTGAFCGFKLRKDGKQYTLIAEPEKAVVDFFYLNLSWFKKDIKNIIIDSFRFQNFEELDKKRLIELGRLFHNKKLLKVIRQFCALIDEERT